MRSLVLAILSGVVPEACNVSPAGRERCGKTLGEAGRRDQVIFERLPARRRPVRETVHCANA